MMVKIRLKQFFYQKWVIKCDKHGDTETRRQGEMETGRDGDGETRRWGDMKMGRIVAYNNSSILKTILNQDEVLVFKSFVFFGKPLSTLW